MTSEILIRTTYMHPEIKMGTIHNALLFGLKTEQFRPVEHVYERIEYWLQDIPFIGVPNRGISGVYDYLYRRLVPIRLIQMGNVYYPSQDDIDAEMERLHKTLAATYRPADTHFPVPIAMLVSDMLFHFAIATNSSPWIDNYPTLHQVILAWRTDDIFQNLRFFKLCTARYLLRIAITQNERVEESIPLPDNLEYDILGCYLKEHIKGGKLT